MFSNWYNPENRSRSLPSNTDVYIPLTLLSLTATILASGQTIHSSCHYVWQQAHETTHTRKIMSVYGRLRVTLSKRVRHPLENPFLSPKIYLRSKAQHFRSKIIQTNFKCLSCQVVVICMHIPFRFSLINVPKT